MCALSRGFAYDKSRCCSTLCVKYNKVTILCAIMISCVVSKHLILSVASHVICEYATYTATGTSRWRSSKWLRKMSSSRWRNAYRMCQCVMCAVWLNALYWAESKHTACSIPRERERANQMFGHNVPILELYNFAIL